MTVMTQALRVLIIDDEAIIHTTLGEYLADAGHRVDHAYDGREGLKKIDAVDYDLALVDVRMPKMDGLALLARAQEIRPDLSCVIITAHGDMKVAVQALRGGAADFLAKPVRLLELDAVVEKAARVRHLRQEGHHLRATIRGIQSAQELRARSQRFVGKSAATGKVHEQIRGAVEARCDTILITGETGTGKEVVAREIHFSAEDAGSPFIAVSCPALPDTLVESELFGHTKGAFTGATMDRPGYFELADGGTLFLDEVADLSASAQAVLLRVLETRAFRRVGGAEEKKVEVRVVAATNADLEPRIEKGQFRRDLFYRLNLWSIHLLPLREHRDDIIPLAEHFLSTYTETRGLDARTLSDEARSLLVEYGYPGNARELRNIVERAAMLSGPSGELRSEHLGLQPPGGRTSPAPASEESEGDRILAALEECKWNRRKAAESLGMPYSTLRYKIQTLGLDRD
jgi:DNA-binding NtrC family response regulator